jgi:hypothetical protein
MNKKNKKTLIEPKVRLLLSIYLQGFPKKLNWQKKLVRNLDYGKGNISTQITSLLDDNFIESKNPNNVGPPYKVTSEGKKFLGPILFASKIGMFLGSYVSFWSVIIYLVYANQPLLQVTVIFPVVMVSFVVLAIVLIFYPYLLLKLGKIHY